MARRPGADGSRLVTLTSDVGSAYAAQLKAALIFAGLAPERIIDLAHDLPAHGLREAAFLLREMARGFPPLTVHLAIVDPGVGGRRAPIVIETKAGPTLVGPDNGLLVPLAEELGVRAAYRIEPGGLRRRPPVGTTFEGRDLFAPAAALLAEGARPCALGPRVEPSPYSVPEAVRTPLGATGEVLHVDRFGNLITNVPSRWIGSQVSKLRFASGKGRLRTVPWTGSYEALGRGALGALGSSFGLVEVAIGEGRATDRLGAGVGSPVTIAWRRRPAVRGAKANSARPRKRR
ncbi:MAG: S-adenosyl-l-methionine hydroxide adenosyltransferase family protein [Thermoplasmata archaeon]